MYNIAYIYKIKIPMKTFIARKNLFSVTHRLISKLNMPYIKYDKKTYNGGELQVIFKQSLDNLDEVYLFIDLWPNPNDKIFELQSVLSLIAFHTKKINLILPFIPYLRQDKNEEYISSGSQILASITNDYNVKKIITFEPHSKNSLKHFNCKIISLDIYQQFKNIIKEEKISKDSLIISPDYGGKDRAKKLSEICSLKSTYFSKKRNGKNIDIYQNNNSLNNIKSAIILDDMVDSGGTIINTIKILKEKNIRIYVLITHILNERKVQEIISQHENVELIYSNTILTNKKPRIDIFEMIEDYIRF